MIGPSTSWMSMIRLNDCAYLKDRALVIRNRRPPPGRGRLNCRRCDRNRYRLVAVTAGPPGSGALLNSIREVWIIESRIDGEHGCGCLNLAVHTTRRERKPLLARAIGLRPNARSGWCPTGGASFVRIRRRLSRPCFAVRLGAPAFRSAARQPWNLWASHKPVAAAWAVA